MLRECLLLPDSSFCGCTPKMACFYSACVRNATTLMLRRRELETACETMGCETCEQHLTMRDKLDRPSWKSLLLAIVGVLVLCVGLRGYIMLSTSMRQPLRQRSLAPPAEHADDLFVAGWTRSQQSVREEGGYGAVQRDRPNGGARDGGAAPRNADASSSDSVVDDNELGHRLRPLRHRSRTSSNADNSARSSDAAASTSNGSSSSPAESSSSGSGSSSDR